MSESGGLMAIDDPVGIEIRQANAEIDAESEAGNLVLGRTVESKQTVRVTGDS